MSRVNPYQEQITAKGSNTDFQDPSTADGGIGAAARSIGQSLARISSQQNAAADDQGKLWAANAAAQNEVVQAKVRDDQVNSLDPDAPDYIDQLNSLPQKSDDAYQASTQALTEQAPNNAARKYVGMHAAGGRVRAFQSSLNTSANLNASYAVSQVGNSVKTSSDVIAQSPDNDTFNSINDQHRQTIMGLTTIDPNTKLKLADQSTNQFALVQAQSLASRDPTGFLQQVGAAGGTTNARGATRGAVPTGTPTAATPLQPDMLDFANQQLASGDDPEVALKALTTKFPDRSSQFTFALSPDGKSFVDRGAAPVPNPGDPQIQPLDENAIASAKPDLAGWDKLTWQQKVQTVRSAESQAGKGLADDRGGMTRDLRDANAALVTGANVPDIEAPRYSEGNLTRIFGADVGGRAYQELQYNRQVGSFMAAAATMPTAQRQATLEHLRPTPGTGFAEQEAGFNAATEANKRIESALTAKPMEYAIKTGIGGAQPLDFSSPENLAKALQNRVAVNNTLQRDYGTRGQIFTDGEVDALNSGLTKLNGTDRIEYLGTIRSSLGDNRQFATAMNQLAPKNPTLAYAANLAVQPGTSFVDGKPVAFKDVASKVADGDIILNGRKLDVSNGDDPAMPTGSKAVNFKEDDFRNMFASQVGPMAFQSPDAQFSASTQTDVYNAVRAYFVADSYQRGQPLDVIKKDDVSRAVQAVTGGVWDRGSGGKVFAPAGMKMSDFQDQWPQRVQSTLEANGFDQKSIDVGANQLQAVNLSNGKYGFLNGPGGRMIVSPKTRQPVIVDYSSPYNGMATDKTIPSDPIVRHR